MKKMRRLDRALSQEETLAILNRAEYGVLSTVSAGGSPYGVPLSFCIIGQDLYFHCAVEGQKIDNILQSPTVSFCAVGTTRILPKKFSTIYESVIVSGKPQEIFKAGKQLALEGLLRKYSPEFFEKGLEYINSHSAETRVFKIRIHKLSGKARKK